MKGKCVAKKQVLDQHSVRPMSLGQVSRLAFILLLGFIENYRNYSGPHLIEGIPGLFLI